MNKIRAAALTFAVLTALSATGILVHQGAAVTGQDGNGVTSPAPRTVVMAEPPAEPCPYPYPMAICAPIPPAPLDAMTDEEREAAASEYTKAWNGIEVTR